MHVESKPLTLACGIQAHSPWFTTFQPHWPGSSTAGEAIPTSVPLSSVLCLLETHGWLCVLTQVTPLKPSSQRGCARPRHLRYYLRPPFPLSPATLSHLVSFSCVACHYPKISRSLILACLLAVLPSPPRNFLPEMFSVLVHSSTSASNRAWHREVLNKNLLAKLKYSPPTPSTSQQTSSIHGGDIYNSPQTSKLGEF